MLLLLGVRWLPRRIPEIEPAEGVGARLRRLRDLALAAAAGGGVSILAYAVMTRPPVDRISQYFLERSYSEGGGTNVVNVILVDFRGFLEFFFSQMFVEPHSTKTQMKALCQALAFEAVDHHQSGLGHVLDRVTDSLAAESR